MQYEQFAKSYYRNIISLNTFNPLVDCFVFGHRYVYLLYNTRIYIVMSEIEDHEM